MAIQVSDSCKRITICLPLIRAFASINLPKRGLIYVNNLACDEFNAAYVELADILCLSGKEVRVSKSLISTLQTYDPGKEAILSIPNGGSRHTCKIQIGGRHLPTRISSATGRIDTPAWPGRTGR